MQDLIKGALYSIARIDDLWTGEAIFVESSPGEYTFRNLKLTKGNVSVKKYFNERNAENSPFTLGDAGYRDSFWIFKELDSPLEENE